MSMPGLVSTGYTFVPNYAWIWDQKTIQQVIVEIDHTISDATLPATYPPGVVRGGTVLGKVTATGVYKQYSDIAGDGTEVAVGILLHPLRPLVDQFGIAIAAGQKVLAAMVIAGTIDKDELIGYDTAAGVDLRAAGFIIKNDF